ncbi:MAG: hypothetical protein OXE41_01130 [Gammaproteobacteria bacterium]|nr:hypothetical protein [Gammaproteobacteria bacterium]MCY4218370.1 hypothetical protein [Gammaproteobacteria bacterium]MCY4273995.1 hypothetical protein [Gammaproteobacteria bacterium]
MDKVKKESLNSANRGLSRTKAAILIMLFLGPLLGAFLWYYGLNAKLVPDQINNSPLVHPPISLQEFANPKHGGASFTLADLKRKWTIVHIVDEDCNMNCEMFLYNTRQVRLAVGRDVHRITRLIVIEDLETVEWFRSEHPDAILIMDAESGIEDQLDSIYQTLDPSIKYALLIDPLGNVMMAIPNDLPPKLLLKDLKKLLKLSRIG